MELTSVLENDIGNQDLSGRCSYCCFVIVDERLFELAEQGNICVRTNSYMYEHISISKCNHLY